MAILDTVLIVILAGFVFYGLFFGFIRTIGSLVGIIVGIFLASLFYLDVYELGKNFVFGFDTIGKVISFILIFTLVDRLVCFLFAILNQAFEVISIIPFVKTINRIGGAVFGLVEGCLIIGLLFKYAGELPRAELLINKLFAKSQVMPFLLKTADMFVQILPSMINQIKNWV